MSHSERSRWLGDAFAIGLLAAGVMLFLALVSYVPEDLPSWMPFSAVAPSSGAPVNFAGRAGSICAGIAFLLVGAASFFLAGVLLALGAARLISARVRVKARMAWTVVAVVSGACLLELQPWVLRDWFAEINVESPGGWIGLHLGRRLGASALGFPTMVALCSAIYLCSLVLLTGFRPVETARATVHRWKRWWEERLHRRMERASPEQLLRLKEKQLRREERILLREMRREGGAPPAPVPAPAAAAAPAPAPPLASPAPNPAPDEGNDVPENAPEPGLRPRTTRRPAAREPRYVLPPVDLFDPAEPRGFHPPDVSEVETVRATLIETLAQFGIEVTPGPITRGPTITRYELVPASGVRVDRIVNLERDLARATCAEQINILAPVPGKNTVGIELANSRKSQVRLGELLRSREWRESRARIPLALGKDVSGTPLIADLAEMPHLLVAGTTGSGKSVCINAIIACLLNRFGPGDVRLMLIDPKMVELQQYGSLPHLVAPVVTDTRQVLVALRWVVEEMESRYALFASVGARNLQGFNSRRPAPRGVARNGPPPRVEEEASGQLALRFDGAAEEIPARLSYLVVIIDELADLMQTAPAEVELLIDRIAKMARAAGIHLIAATQTPRADIITGAIKANIPVRIAFKVASKVDSRVILDQNGADRLLGRGDMLLLPPRSGQLVRAQGSLVSDEEIERMVRHICAQRRPDLDQRLRSRLEEAAVVPTEDVGEDDEELIARCVGVIRQEKRASTSMLQRRLRLGYTRAARIMDILEQRGIVGPGDGAKPREILVDPDSYVE